MKRVFLKGREIVEREIFLEIGEIEKNLLVYNNVEKLYKVFYYQGNYNLTFL